MIFQVQDIKTYGFKKKSYISVSLTTTPKKKSIAKIAPSVKKIATTRASSSSKGIDVNNLFSDVWTQKIHHKVKKIRQVDSKRISEIQKQIKLQKNNEVKPLVKTDEQLEKKNKSINAESSANEVNEYLAKIQAIVYKHFNVPPNTEGNRVKTLITLDPFGKMLDFKVLTYSASKALNSEVDRIKERLKNVVFPMNPSGKTTTTIVTLISKE